MPFLTKSAGPPRTPRRRPGALLNLETMIGAAFGALAFGDPSGGPHVAGAVAILLGIALSAERGRIVGMYRRR